MTGFMQVELVKSTMKACEGAEFWIHPFLNSELDRSKLLALRCAYLNPREGFTA
jgi:hypothetical protein